MSQLLFPPSANAISKQINANYTNADTVITLTNTTSIQNKPGMCLINRVDTNGTLQATSTWTYIEFTATSGATLTGCTVISGGQDQALGKVVEFVSDVIAQQRILDALTNLVVIATGAVDTTKVVTPAGTQTLTNKTITSPVINTPTGDVATLTGTQTLSNKRWTKRTGTTTSHATPTINTDNVSFYSLTAQAEDITSFTTNLSGTPVEGDTLWIAITGTAARAITWGASFEDGAATLPITTETTLRLDIGFVRNTVTSKWRCMAKG